jgi:hypothetical protein
MAIGIFGMPIITLMKNTRSQRESIQARRYHDSCPEP